MERPIYLRENAYLAILDSLSAHRVPHRDVAKSAGYDVKADDDDANALNKIMATPSRYLYYCCDLMARADLLTGLFVEFDDDELDAGLTYLIDAEGAQEITAGDTTVMLRSGIASVLVPRARLERAFANGCVIDYRE